MFKLFKNLKKYWYLLIIVVCFLAMQAYLQLLLPNAMSNITSIVTSSLTPNSIYNPDLVFPHGWSVPFLSPSGDYMNDILIVGGYMLILSSLTFCGSIICSNLIAFMGSRFAKTLRLELFKKIENFSLGDFNKFGSASLITRTTNDIIQVQQMFQMGIRTVVFAPLYIIIAIIMILGKDPRLALIIAISIPVIIILVVVLFIIANPLFARLQVSIDNTTKVIREGLTGVRVIRAFNQEESERKRFDKENTEMTKIITKVGRTMSFANPVINIMFNVTYIAIFFYGYALINGVVIKSMEDFPIDTLSNVMATSQYAMTIMMAFLMTSMLLIMFPRANTCAKRINEVFAVKPLIKDKERTLSSDPKVRGWVEFKDVTFTFPDASVPTLKGISFIAKPGTTTAIIGSTGSGKSSIINLIPRFYDASLGQILVDNINVKDFAQKDLRNKIGFVPQQALLFKGTIKDNLLFGNDKASEEEMFEALRVAQAKKFVEKKENGLLSEVSQGGKNFSGGQKQRLAIARALVRKPEIYIFDDSFSALDFKTDVKLRAALKDYTKDSSVIIVAQRVSSIMYADNIIVLNDGEIVGQGKHDKLLKTCNVYQEIVYSQMDKEEIEKTKALELEAKNSKGEDDNA